MFKSYQYATNHIKISTRLRNLRLKEIQVGLKKTITWTKKCGKRKQVCEHSCSINGMLHKKLKTYTKSKVTNKDNFIYLFITFEFLNANIFCYDMQKFMSFQQKMLKAQVGGYCRNSHIYLKLGYIGLCDESIKGPLVFVICFNNYYIYYEHGS